MSPKTNLEKGVGSLCDIRTAPIAVLLMIALLSASVLVAVS